LPPPLTHASAAARASLDSSPEESLEEAAPSIAAVAALAALLALMKPIILLSAETYARADETTMSSSAPLPLNVRWVRPPCERRRRMGSGEYVVGHRWWKEGRW
jgi:hypothetical protein